MAEMVQEVIVSECKNSDIGLYYIKCDETRDAINIEDMSVILRDVINGVANERLLSLVEMEAVGDESITTAILQELQGHSLDPAGILSQCYDGASVMSGVKGGVQMLLQYAIGSRFHRSIVLAINCIWLSCMQWRLSQRLGTSLHYNSSCTSFSRDSLLQTSLKVRR